MLVTRDRALLACDLYALTYTCKTPLSTAFHDYWYATNLQAFHGNWLAFELYKKHSVQSAPHKTRRGGQPGIYATSYCSLYVILYASASLSAIFDKDVFRLKSLDG
jgi:hypothetical protein